MTEEEIRERDAKCGFGKDHNKVIMGWQAEKDRRWLLRELEQVRKAYENQGLLLAGTAEQLAEVSQQLAEAHRELDRVRKDLVICRKSKSVYDYSDKMSERLKAEVNHLLKEKVKRLEQQLAAAQKDTERLDFLQKHQGLTTEGLIFKVPLASKRTDIRLEIDGARGKE